MGLCDECKNGSPPHPKHTGKYTTTKGGKSHVHDCTCVGCTGDRGKSLPFTGSIQSPLMSYVQTPGATYVRDLKLGERVWPILYDSRSGLVRRVR